LLEGEGAEAAVVGQRRVSVGRGHRPRRADGADDLALGDAVVLVEEDVGVLGALPVGGEGDEQLDRLRPPRRLLGRKGSNGGQGGGEGERQEAHGAPDGRFSDASQKRRTRTLLRSVANHFAPYGSSSPTGPASPMKGRMRGSMFVSTPSRRYSVAANSGT